MQMSVGDVRGCLHGHNAVPALLEKGLELLVNLDLQYVEPLDSIAKASAKWVLDKSILPKCVSNNLNT